jgi:eukaryotic-like serine/threonine-protein kinase
MRAGAAAVDRASWERLATLFDELVELPEAERRALLEALARDAPDVARAVTKLLAADTGTAVLLDTPLALAPLAGDAGANEATEPSPPRAGVYRIVGRLGRGGMAEVFAGERDDGVFEQRVAIKVLRRGLDTDDLLARFARERNARSSPVSSTRRSRACSTPARSPTAAPTW